MRTKTLLLTAALGAAGVAAAMAQDPVFSVNAVGYVNKNLTAGFNLIANPLSNGGNTLNEIIPDGTGLTVNTYNGSGFTASSFIPGVGWLPDQTVPPGVGFYVEAPSDTTLTFIGEVPQGEDSNMTLPMGISLVASPVPQAGDLTADLGFPGDSGMTINTYDGSGFTASSFIPGLGWLPVVNVEVGQGFWLEAAADAQWDRDFSVNN
jgi:hypothetical protein